MKLSAAVMLMSTNDTSISLTKMPTQTHEKIENVSRAIKAAGGD